MKYILMFKRILLLYLFCSVLPYSAYTVGEGDATPDSSFNNLTSSFSSEFWSIQGMDEGTGQPLGGLHGEALFPDLLIDELFNMPLDDILRTGPKEEVPPEVRKSTKHTKSSAPQTKETTTTSHKKLSTTASKRKRNHKKSSQPKSKQRRTLQDPLPLQEHEKIILDDEMHNYMVAVLDTSTLMRKAQTKGKDTAKEQIGLDNSQKLDILFDIFNKATTKAIQNKYGRHSRDYSNYCFPAFKAYCVLLLEDKTRQTLAEYESIAEQTLLEWVIRQQANTTKCYTKSIVPFLKRICTLLDDSNAMLPKKLVHLFILAKMPLYTCSVSAIMSNRMPLKTVAAPNSPVTTQTNDQWLTWLEEEYRD